MITAEALPVSKSQKWMCGYFYDFCVYISSQLCLWLSYAIFLFSIKMSDCLKEITTR